MPWNELQIAPTRDEREIRRAYARLLKTRQHEGDPAYFERLRQAYEHALWLCRQPPDDESGTTGADTEPLLADGAAPEAERASPNAAEPAEASGPTPEQLADQPLFDDLNTALQKLDTAFGETDARPPEAVIEAWRGVAGHPLVQRLDVREQVSDVMADMIARRWPASAGVWPLAAREFAWEPPTGQDGSRQAHALRWLFDASEGEEARWQSLRDAYASSKPHPEVVLARREPAWRRYLRFAFQRGERVMMRRYLAEADSLNVGGRLNAEAESAAWWRSALDRPMLTRRYLLPWILFMLPLLFSFDEAGAWISALLNTALIALCYGGAVAWHRWRRDRGPLLDARKAPVRLGPPVLLAGGVLVAGAGGLLGWQPLLALGVLGCVASAAWVWVMLAPTSRLRYTDDGGLFRFGLVFLLVMSVFAASLPATGEGKELLQLLYGGALALWIMLAAAPMLGAYEAQWPWLAERSLEYGIAVAAGVLLVAHLLGLDYGWFQLLLLSFDALLMLFCWACAVHREWRITAEAWWWGFGAIVVLNPLVRAAAQDEDRQLLVMIVGSMLTVIAILATSRGRRRAKARAA